MNKNLKSSDFFIWFTGLALGLAIIMISGMLVLIVSKSSDYYIPKKLVLVQTKQGEFFLGQITETLKRNSLNSTAQIQLKVANRDYYGSDFIWLDFNDIAKIENDPKNATIIERAEYGNFFGFIKSLQIDDKNYNYNQKDFNEQLEFYLETTKSLRSEIKDIEKNDISKVNYEIDKLRTRIKKYDYEQREKNIDYSAIIRSLEQEIEDLNDSYFELRSKTDSLFAISKNYGLNISTAGDFEKFIPLIQVFDIYFPNKLSLMDKISFGVKKIISFISDEPRESNTEGGIAPAIFGTILMVMMMSLAAVPLGVLTALYLREYAKQGWLVRIVRIAVNNLAGVPSIVFGIFGLGFFIYTVGGTIDILFYPENLPAPTWGTGGLLWASLTLALLTVPVVIVSTEEALDSIPVGIREASAALGATKWQTTYKVILPAAAPGIMTGVILAMARGAGEVAPLMITGVVKLAPALPFDWNYPFFHLDRKFMHLGFHIYDVGFQSPNIEAAMPMVYMTTILLIFIVLMLNIIAVTIRTRLRKRFRSNEF